MAAEADAWQMVQRGGPIDAKRFLRSLRVLAEKPTLSPRDQLLLRDGFVALEGYWGPAAMQNAVQSAGVVPSHFARVDTSTDEGFHTLRERMADTTDPEAVLNMLRELGAEVRKPSTITIGGSLSLMLSYWIDRVTEDVDLVDEVPPALREQPALLDEYAQRYGLRITHFQSHYLPDGWRSRVQSLGVFGSITAFRVDPVDVLVGKMFSRRKKDLDDIRHSLAFTDLQTLRERVGRDGKSLASDPQFEINAKHNWYVLTGEPDFPRS